MKNRPTLVLGGLSVVLAVALVVVLLVTAGQAPPDRGFQPLVDISRLEPDPKVWSVNFPRQYDTWLRTQEQQATAWGGSEPYSKLERDPRLVKLFAGYPFSKDYNEERGHYWSVTDVSTTGRAPTAGTCWTCKSAVVPGLMEQMTPATFYATSFQDLASHFSEDKPISCADCHDSATMALVITRPAFREAMERQGIDLSQATRQEMRTYVCGQCHVEYYFAGEGRYLTFPWANGTRFDDMETYYDELSVNGEPFKDWVHPDSGAPLIKAQHPEFEFFTANSTHFAAGVSCADCHMPYARDGATKYSSHFVASPLKYAEQACGQCHTDVQYVTNRVATIQGQVMAHMDRTEDALVAAIDAIAQAAQHTGVNQALLTEARQLHRRAQFRWDFIAAENSAGFHNPEEALRLLGEAIDYARQAERKALEASITQAAGGR
jgi:nitrite reductase (cytochrome c-552)